ncbi:unnamed protein product [marine sediment metagenome]|uniref:Uncharacterized protein n=1 Tax=marine sediment metagenome TaxID=412755 RepID=X0WDX1_9ZZZZ
MDINNTYMVKINKKKFFVYDGTCDGRPTKWLTQSTWNGKISLYMKNGEIKYQDGKGKSMLIFEKGEKEYDMY